VLLTSVVSNYLHCTYASHRCPNRIDRDSWALVVSQGALGVGQREGEHVFRYLVLGLLRDGAARHGYALMKAYRDRTNLPIGTSSFYRELQRLAAEGLVCTVDNPRDADPRRAPYAITEAGGVTFDTWLCHADAIGMISAQDDVSVRALFFDGADRAVVQQLIESWRTDLWSRGKQLETDRKALIAQRNQTGGPFDPWPSLLARRLKHVAADVDFLEELRRNYEQTKGTRDRSSRAQANPARPARPVAAAPRRPKSR